MKGMCSQYGRLLQVDRRSFEMGYTPAEFEKTLIGQFNSNTSYQVKQLTHNHWSLSHVNESFDVEVKIASAKPRKIAMLTLPVLDTEFSFINASESQQQELLKTFFKYFHKGGG